MSDDEKTEVSEARPEGWLTTKRRVSIAVGVLVIVAIGLVVVNQLIKSKSTDRVAVSGDVQSIEVSAPGTVTLTDGQLAVSRTSKYVFKKPGASAKVDKGVLKLKANCGGVRVGGCSVAYAIVVPSNISVTVNNSGGSVEVKGAKSDVRAVTKSGSVILNDSYGRIDVQTNEGKVTGTALSSRDVSVKTQTGPIALRFSAAPSNVNADSKGGVVTVQVPKSSTTFNVDASSQSGKTTTDIPRDGSSPFVIKAHSETGAVTVETK